MDSLNTATVSELLCRIIGKREISLIVSWAMADVRNLENIYRLSESADERQSTNALWCMTHLPASASAWLHSKQNTLIDRILAETHPAKKRNILQLLRDQPYNKDSIRADFLDYCLSKINSECEPYAIRCYCLHCAYKMCRFYPELIAELEEHLNILSTQNLSPGLQSALRTTRKNIDRPHLRQMIRQS